MEEYIKNFDNRVSMEQELLCRVCYSVLFLLSSLEKTKFSKEIHFILLLGEYCKNFKIHFKNYIFMAYLYSVPSSLFNLLERTKFIK